MGEITKAVFRINLWCPNHGIYVITAVYTYIFACNDSGKQFFFWINFGAAWHTGICVITKIYVSVSGKKANTKVDKNAWMTQKGLRCVNVKVDNGYYWISAE